MKTKTIVIAAILIAFIATSASAETLFISPAEIPCPAVGNTLSISVNIGDAEDVYGIQFDLLYDSDALEFLTVGKGDFPSSGFIIDPRVKDGKLDNIAISKLSGDGEDGSGTVFHIDFSVKKAKGSELILSDVKILDSKGSQIDDVTIEDATIKTFCPWDVNDDEEVDISDLVLVGRHFGDEGLCTCEDLEG